MLNWSPLGSNKMKHLSNTKKEWSSSRKETRQLKTDETLSVHKLPVVLMGLERYSVIFVFAI